MYGRWNELSSVQVDIGLLGFRVLDEAVPVFVLRQNRFLSENDQQRTCTRDCNVHAFLALQESQSKLLVAVEESRMRADSRYQDDFSFLALELFDGSDFRPNAVFHALSDKAAQFFDLQCIGRNLKKKGISCVSDKCESAYDSDVFERELQFAQLADERKDCQCF